MLNRTTLAAWGALALITLLFFWQLALTNQIMVGVDIFTYFYPYRSAVDEALLQGRLPLWNPYLYMGVPLLANGQAGVFYPLNWPFIFLPAPLAVNASIVLHVVLAAIFFQLFARLVLGLSHPAAFLAASVYAFSGYVGSLVEHVNQLQAAVWFPLLIVCLERARPGRRGPYVLLGGLIFALQLLAGHAQVSFISIFGLGLWLLARQPWSSLRPWSPLPETIRRARPLAKSIGFDLVALLGIALIGASLAAVQLVPMLELARLSIRAGGMTYREAVAFSLPPQRLLESLLPTFGLGDAISSEFISFIGVGGVILMLAGVRVFGRARAALLLLLLAGLALALGLFDPLYYLLFKLVPGFGLFRVPARWMFLAVVGAAGFAGFGFEAVRNRRVFEGLRALAVWLVLAFVLAAGAVVAILARLRIISPPALPVAAAWLAVALLVLTLMWLAGTDQARASAARLGHTVPWVHTLGLCALALCVLLELFIATRWLPYNQLTAPEAWSSLRPSVAWLLSDNSTQPFRVLSYSDLTWDPGDLHDIEAIFAGQLSARSIYEYTVAAKAKEIVAPNLAMRYHLQSVDGYDGGVLPLARFVALESLLLPPDQINPDGRLRERLHAPPATRWLDLFNVRYLIADKVFDVWVDGIYYDLGMGLDLAAGDSRPHPITLPAGYITTALGVISNLSGAASLPTGTPVAELLATDSEGVVHTFTLRAGRETSEAVYAPAQVAHAQARVVHTERDQPQANEYHALYTLPAPASFVTLTLRALLPAGTFALRGLTLLGVGGGSGVPLTLSPDGQYRLAQSGDVKIYERVDAPSRAILLHRTTIVTDDGEALRQLSAPAFDPGTQLLLAAGKVLNSASPSTVGVVSTYAPERIVVQTNDNAEGYLLLKDAWYPGWRAWVDGNPATIERADTYFRAIYLGPGAHTVELMFMPESLGVGAALSLAAMTACIAAALLIWTRRKSRGTK